MIDISNVQCASPILQYQYYQIAFSTEKRHFQSSIFHSLQLLPREPSGYQTYSVKKLLLIPGEKIPVLTNSHLFGLSLEDLYFLGGFLNHDDSPYTIASELMLS